LISIHELIHELLATHANPAHFDARRAPNTYSAGHVGAGIPTTDL